MSNKKTAKEVEEKKLVNEVEAPAAEENVEANANPVDVETPAEAETETPAEVSDEKFTKAKIRNCVKLNVRTQPSMSSDIVTVLDANVSFTAKKIEDSSEWVKVKVGELTGFSRAEYVLIF